MCHKIISLFIVISIILYPLNFSNSYELNQFKISKDNNIIIINDFNKINKSINLTASASFIHKSISKNIINMSSSFLDVFDTNSESLTKVKKIITPISEEELKFILSETHIKVFNKPAPDKRIHMAWAQIAIENGRGKKVYNHNLGNIGTDPINPKGSYYKVAGSKFRSFTSFEDGAIHYWQHLKKRCSSSLRYFDLGDPYTASLALNKCGYYRSDIKFYQKNLSSLYFESIKK